MAGDAEARRLDEADRLGVPWRRWGPYLSERQWGTVREDYSPTGDAWSSFPHDHARSRAYRWGEDGIAGISDDKQRLCFSLALWNGRDPILKERMFGLTNSEGNHGEDVKEYYFYLDSTPTHSYLSFLYKYPQAEYPYGDLVATNRARSKTDYEYELLDTGDLRRRPLLRRGGRVREGVGRRTCWSGSPSTIEGRTPRRSTSCRRCWFRNTWSWGLDGPSPALHALADRPGIAAEHADLGTRWLYCDADVPLLFTENETNTERLFGTPRRLTLRQGRDRPVRRRAARPMR